MLDHILCKRRNGGTVRQLRTALGKMTVKGLESVKRVYGIKASGRKTDLIEKLVVRLPFNLAKPPVAIPMPSAARVTVPDLDLKTWKIKLFEDGRGTSWLVHLLNQLDHKFEGVPYEGMFARKLLNRFYMLLDGKFWGKMLDRILQNELFIQEFGSMTQDQLRRVLAKVPTLDSDAIPMVGNLI